MATLEQVRESFADFELHEAWAVVTNSDLTEGRGHNVVLAVCVSESTAHRLAKGRGVQGCNAEVRQTYAIRDHRVPGGHWIPGNLEQPNKEDAQVDKLRAEREEAREKALSLGLTEEDIHKLSALLRR